MQRILGFALALVNAKDGLLLIDEVENSFPSTVQVDVWRLIFRLARHLPVQVFATSCSWDCIQAFQKAVQEIGDGLILRLEQKKGMVSPTVFDARKLESVTREQIEVRQYPDQLHVTRS